MGRYQAYPEYKDSGVEWLDKVPTHWLPTSLKMVVEVRDGTHDTPEYVAVSDDTYPLVTSKDVTSGTVLFELCKHISEQDYLQIVKRSKVDEGDILMPMIGTVGSPVVTRGECKFAIKNLALFKTSFSKKVDPIFLNYFLQSTECSIQLGLESRGGVQNFVSLGVLRNLGFTNPKLTEQQKIAAFLDHETAKIDALIEKQQQLIQLLKEKRQAVISHAVTKGLNPNAPMKDSGIEWLGEVPAHWDVVRFKNIFKIEKRIAGSLGFDVLSITQKGIKVKDITSGDGQLSMDYSKYQLVKTGEYAMNHMDLLTGFVDISDFDGVTSPDYRVFSLIRTDCVKEYYLYILQMGYLNRLFYPLGQGAATVGRWRLPTDAFYEFQAPCPPEKEQREIFKFIENSLNKFDCIQEEAEKLIGLLYERRTALISAAVTGKIDVRNFSEPATR
jgi:type I restriction enzyme S subunit